jgi:hypothetical protein
VRSEANDGKHGVKECKERTLVQGAGPKQDDGRCGAIEIYINPRLGISCLSCPRRVYSLKISSFSLDIPLIQNQNKPNTLSNIA